MHGDKATLEDPALKWNGDFGKPERMPKPSTVVTLADVVGDALGVGDGTLLPLGSVMDIVDLAAGRCAHSFMEGPTVTVSVDFGTLRAPIRRGDLVQCNANVIDVGSSSITVSVSAKREDLENARDGAKPLFVECLTTQLTFVAVDVATGRPKKNVPALLLETDDAAKVAQEVKDRKAATRELDTLLKNIDSDPVDTLPFEKCVDAFPELRRGVKTVDDSKTELRKQYLPRHENFGGIVFGGDILMLVERAALYCAKRYSGFPNVSCVYMHGLHFRLPIQPTYLLRQHEGRPLEISHTGFFSVVAHDDAGKALPVPYGLDWEHSSEEAKRACVKAALRLGQQHLGIKCEEYLTELFARSS